MEYMCICVMCGVYRCVVWRHVHGMYCGMCTCMCVVWDVFCIYVYTWCYVRYMCVVCACVHDMWLVGVVHVYICLWYRYMYECVGFVSTWCV